MEEPTQQEIDKLHIAMTKRDGWLEGTFPYAPTVLIGMVGLSTVVIFNHPMVSIIGTALALLTVGFLFSRDQDLLSILRVRLKIYVKKLGYGLRHNAAFCRGRRYRP